MKHFKQIKDHSLIINKNDLAHNESGNTIYEKDDVGKEYKKIINVRPFKNGIPDGTHGKEKLYYVWSSDNKNWEGYIPLFNGELEDPFLLPKKNGRYVLACEYKPKGQDATDTVVFASETIESFGWDKLVKTIKPQFWFDAHSVMSPTLKYEGNNICHYYEGRYEPDLNKFQVGLIVYFAIDFHTIKRYSEPIVDGYTIFDDITEKQSDGYYYATTHDFDDVDRPKISWWRGQIWRSKHLDKGWSKWVDLITTDGLYPMAQMLIVNGKISLHYSLWRSFQGIRLAYPVYNEQPPNGGSMKPIASFDGDKLVATNVDSGDKIAWQCKDVNGYFIGFGNPFDISGKNYKKDGAEFWCYPNAETSNVSNRVVYGSVVEPPIDPSTDEIDIIKIREHAQAILDLTE